jgi:hypothetical protein
MKIYPTISRDVRYGRDYLVYDKVDGQNIRAEWSKKKGFYKFGSRQVLIGDVESAAIEACVRELEPEFASIFKKKRLDRVTCFFEWFGPNSFAGMHEPDDEMGVVLLDVWIPKRGILDPRDYEKWFRGKVPLPALLHRGNFNKVDEAAVRADCFKGVTFEGVVVKGHKPHNQELPPMFKVKTQKWIDRVQERYGPKAEEKI